MMLGIIIEGPDYAGKSTIAPLVATRLAEAGIRVKRQQACLSEGTFGRLVTYLQERITRHSSLKTLVFHVCYLFDCLQVALWRFFDRERPLIVQESYVDRVIAYGTTHGRRHLAPALALIAPLLTRHFAKFYLDAPFEERKRRYELAPSTDERDHIRFGSGAHWHRLVASDLRARAAEQGYTFLDSGSLGPEAIADHIARETLSRWTSRAASRRKP